MAFSRAAVVVVAIAVGVGLLLQTYGIFHAVEWQKGTVEKDLKFLYIDHIGSCVRAPYCC